MNAAPTPPCYRGRFAPTPSGPLHLGSLLTALASFLQARAAGGRWLLRIDDLDRARCVPGAAATILRQLEQHGLLWDETPRHQHAHLEAYAAALERLRRDGLVYACDCSRAELARSARSGPDGPVYPDRCRERQLPDAGQALRLRINVPALDYVDGWQGPQRRATRDEIGDFIVWRRDGVPGYQLSCAIDEAAQGITEVVRGADLLGSTFQQLLVMAALELPAPRYRHLPVWIGADGRKLSKQNHAAPLEAAQAADNLWRCLQALGQEPESALRRAPVATVLDWALAHWRPAAVPARRCTDLEPDSRVWHDGLSPPQCNNPDE